MPIVEVLYTACRIGVGIATYQSLYTMFQLTPTYDAAQS